MARRLNKVLEPKLMQWNNIKLLSQCQIQSKLTRQTRVLAQNLILIASLCAGGIANANNLVWVPSVVNYLQNEPSGDLTPTLDALPSEDSDGKLSIEWQGNTESYVLEMSYTSASTIGITDSVQNVSALKQFAQAYNVSTSSLSTTEGAADGEWQTVYSGAETSVDLSDLAEGDYQFRVAGCDDEASCSDAATSNVVTVSYAITPLDDSGYVVANGNLLIDVLANDWDPTQPDLSIYDIASDFEVTSLPNYGQVSRSDNKFLYVNISQNCSSNNTFFDMFSYRIIDRNGQYSTDAQVLVEVQCSNSFVLPTWIELPTGSTPNYTLYKSNDGYLLKAQASQWASMGFLTIPIYQEGDFLLLSFENDQWQTADITQTAFNAAALTPLENAILAYDSSGSATAVQLDLSEGEIIAISWPSAAVGQTVNVQKTHPDSITCELLSLSTDRYTKQDTGFVFYQAGTHKSAWQCTDSLTARSYVIDSLVTINWLNAPVLTRPQE